MSHPYARHFAGARLVFEACPQPGRRSPIDLLRLLAIGTDLVAVGIADVGDVVAAVGRTGSGLALVGAAVGERGGMELLDRPPGARRQGDHRSVAEGRRLLVVRSGHEELRLLRRALRAVAEVAVAVPRPRETERREGGVIEFLGALQIVASNHHVGEHLEGLNRRSAMSGYERSD